MTLKTNCSSFPLAYSIAATASVKDTSKQDAKMTHVFQRMLVECSTQLRLCLAQFNRSSQFSLKGNIPYAKSPHSTEMTSVVLRLKQCFQVWFQYVNLAFQWWDYFSVQFLNLYCQDVDLLSVFPFGHLCNGDDKGKVKHKHIGVNIF